MKSILFARPGLSADEAATIFPSNKVPLQKEEHSYFLRMSSCQVVVAVLTITLYLVVATDGKKAIVRERGKSSSFPGSERLFWINLMS